MSTAALSTGRDQLHVNIKFWTVGTVLSSASRVVDRQIDRNRAPSPLNLNAAVLGSPELTGLLVRGRCNGPDPARRDRASRKVIARQFAVNGTLQTMRQSAGHPPGTQTISTSPFVDRCRWSKQYRDGRTKVREDGVIGDAKLAWPQKATRQRNKFQHRWCRTFHGVFLWQVRNRYVTVQGLECQCQSPDCSPTVFCQTLTDTPRKTTVKICGM